MIPFPLTRANRILLAHAFAEVPRVDISIDCALEDQMGEVFVDTLESPTCFMIRQGGFFYYFAGDLGSDAGQAFLRAMPGGGLLMTGDAGWGEAMVMAFGERLVPIQRFGYSSASLSLDHLKALASANPYAKEVRRMDITLASTLQDPYLELSAFNSPADFVERGIGFCVMEGDKAIGSAFSGLVSNSAIEISIFVDPEHRRKGISTALACTLLTWCFEHKIDPHWDAANEESCSLAEKLGYTRIGEYRAHFLRP